MRHEGRGFVRGLGRLGGWPVHVGRGRPGPRDQEKPACVVSAPRLR